MYSSHATNKVPQSEIEMLIVNALGVVEAKLGNMKTAYQYFDLAQCAAPIIQSNRENANVVGYQYGYALFLDERYQDALKELIQSFNRVMEIESYFMLPEYALLIMSCYEHLGNDAETNKYKAKFEVFKDLN